jgi:hypothetical protein
MLPTVVERAPTSRLASVGGRDEVIVDVTGPMGRPRHIDALRVPCHTNCMTASKPHRINARLPPDVARKVSYLERRGRMTTTQVLRESIELYYATVTRETSTAASALEQAGFVGCASGPRDLSSTYKAQLADSLEEKS